MLALLNEFNLFCCDSPQRAESSRVALIETRGGNLIERNDYEHDGFDVFSITNNKASLQRKVIKVQDKYLQLISSPFNQRRSLPLKEGERESFFIQHANQLVICP